MSHMPETCISWNCAGDTLVGILHRAAGTGRRLGVLVVVGGPQYRVGSHRQFVLLARALAAEGFPVLRFDHRGAGDSTGTARGFEAMAVDIRSAMDAMFRECPDLESVVAYGLCDAASALLMYVPEDTRIGALILANPWVRSPVSEAKTFMRHYYAGRLLQRSFWRNVVRGRLDVRASLQGIAKTLSRLVERRESSGGMPGFVERMCMGLRSVRGPVLIQLSSDDLTAREFELTAAAGNWRSAMNAPGVKVEAIEGADHTFSSREALYRHMTGALTFLQSVSQERVQ